MSSRTVSSTAFTSYGVSRQRNGFTQVEGTGTITSEEIIAAGSGMFSVLAEDLTNLWTMYNGDPVAGNEYRYSNDWNGLGTSGEIIQKQFFEQVPLNRPSYIPIISTGIMPYGGLANFTEMPTPGDDVVDADTDCFQHVMLFESTNSSLPNNGSVSRGIPQAYRIRFEFDLRPRLKWLPVAGDSGRGDREFHDELYQLNLRLKNAGLPLYQTGSIINDELFKPTPYAVGYDFNGTLGASGFGIAGDASNPPNANGWESEYGIPNPMYGWVKVAVASSGQLLTSGSLLTPQLSTDGLVTLENGSTIDTSILRLPGECVDMHFEDVSLVADPANVGPYWLYGTHTDFTNYPTTKGYYYPMYLDEQRAKQHSAAADPATIDIGNVATIEYNNPIRITTTAGVGGAGSGGHGLQDGQPIRILNLNGDAATYNDRIYFAKTTTNVDVFEIFSDSQLSTTVDGTGNTVLHDNAVTQAVVYGGSGTATMHTFSEFPTATFYMPTHGSTTGSFNKPDGTQAPYSKYINNRSIKFRNKRKGLGWFKRFPKTHPDLSGTYPFSYRLTMTERGLVFYLYDEAAGDQADDYAWMCTQRTVNNQTGMPRTDEASKFPVHTLYSCSRESLYSQDFGVYFSTAAANLQTAETTVDTVYDIQGNTYSLGSLDNSKNFYIMSPYDREDYLADEYTAKNIWRFVAREFDVTKATDVHKYATRHQVDSNAIINPLEQLSITDENRFVITFPTGLTTQRYMYPKEETDLICFSSAEVVAESSNIPMTTYLYDGVSSDKRRYQGMRSTAAYGNGMRILVLVNGQYIFNSDVVMDVNDSLGIAYVAP